METTARMMIIYKDGQPTGVRAGAVGCAAGRCRSTKFARMGKSRSHAVTLTLRLRNEQRCKGECLLLLAVTFIYSLYL